MRQQVRRFRTKQFSRLFDEMGEGAFLETPAVLSVAFDLKTRDMTTVLLTNHTIVSQDR
jgi:hypothetical protein